MTDVTINWFEVPATDTARAARFYETLLDTQLGSMDGPQGPMRTFMHGEQPAGALVDGAAAQDQNGPLVYFGTGDLDAALSRVGPAGGQVLMPKTSIGPFGCIAHLRDSEGNRIALHSPG